MKTAFIDNNDSFTYILIDYLQKIKNNKISVFKSDSLSLKSLKEYDKIILSPGPGLPEDFENLYAVIDYYHRTKPILGLCLGHQAIAQYFGAKLTNLSPVVHGQARSINVLTNSLLFKGLPSPFIAGLYHSWAVSKKYFPDELSIDAVSEQDIIMSISSRKFPVWGVQFHPESYITRNGFTLLKNFILY